jgi:hypothetical protein
VLPRLEKVQEDLTVCEKALNEFMDSKRVAFPRFYFVSPADLLDILSNGNAPVKVMIHMPKIISALDTLQLLEEGVRPFAKGMVSGVGKEYVPFTVECKLRKGRNLYANGFRYHEIIIKGYCYEFTQEVQRNGQRILDRHGSSYGNPSCQ